MMEMMDGNVSEVINIAKMFLEIGPQMIDSIDNAIKTEDWVTASDAAHRLKTSLKLWQMTTLINLAVSIENNGYDSSNADGIKDDFVELKKGLNIALKQIQEEFSL